ncbi:DUF3800 domain-containing protein [Fibrobacter sp. UWEL]|uniref:DUF3800 domain-containing protein n=1 Tax=Fibrobacter sp. UWEL TaxID=1896209 RepID=UPI00091312F2|nr:DUF3800 domain-containing protein [Fibrobacter sp. UWEL]SHK79429.1 Protein of unknown function [Fibrobacter sp. UWEL]
MKETENVKAYYYFDEAGDPNILGRHGVNLIESGVASKVFMVGYLETKNPKELTKSLNALHKEICEDELLQGIPSMEKTKVAFHAAKDCAEVRDRVFRLLKNLDFTYYCVVLRKKEDFFRNRFEFKNTEIYKYAVKNLLENRLHLYSEIDCYFSALGNVVRKDTMQSAIDSAIEAFSSKWHHENKNVIRILIQQAAEIPLLQASDYVLWSIQRAYEKGEFRFYNCLKDKIKLVYDILDLKKYPKNYYGPKNMLEKQKMDPL